MLKCRLRINNIVSCELSPERCAGLGAFSDLVHFVLKIGSLVHDAMSLAVIECLLLDVGALTHL